MKQNHGGLLPALRLLQLLPGSSDVAGDARNGSGNHGAGVESGGSVGGVDTGRATGGRIGRLHFNLAATESRMAGIRPDQR